MQEALHLMERLHVLLIPLIKPRLWHDEDYL